MLNKPIGLRVLAARIAAGEVNATALLAEGLGAIVAHDSAFHAMLALNPRAEAEVSRCDAARDGQAALGPLHGLPIVVKDNIDVAGMASTSGCLALAHAMPREEAPVVARLRQAGAVIVGKTNLSEFSFEIRSRSSLGGDVLCPFARHATAGGSSGGSAVAVALGYAAAALGTDTGGSIRVPAALNGLVGFRPAHGALPMAGIAPLAPPTDTVGPIARKVADARLLYEVMGGTVKSRPAPRRVGMLRQAFGAQAEVQSALTAAMAALADAGIDLIDPIEIADLDELLAGTHIVDVAFASSFDAYLASNFLPETAPASLKAILDSGEFLAEYHETLLRRCAADSGAIAGVIARHDQLRKALEQRFAEHSLDALLYPTLQSLPENLDNPAGAWAAELAARSGWPALSVPAAPLIASGRPIGIEFLATVGEEDRLFALGHIIEAAATAA